jgi:hypothetical protein
VAIKVINPIDIEAVNREIMILYALQGGPNIVQIVDVITDPTDD